MTENLSGCSMCDNTLNGMSYNELARLKCKKTNDEVQEPSNVIAFKIEIGTALMPPTVMPPIRDVADEQYGDVE